MNRNRLIWSLWLVATCWPAAASAQVQWLTSIDQARVQAKDMHRFVLVHFWSETCIPCQQLERSVFSQGPFIAALQANYVPVKINLSELPDLGRQYQISSVPTDIVMTPDGRVLSQMTSPQDLQQYIANLNQVAAHARLLQRTPASLAGSPRMAAPSTELPPQGQEMMNPYVNGPSSAVAPGSGIPPVYAADFNQRNPSGPNDQRRMPPQFQPNPYSNQGPPMSRPAPYGDGGQYVENPYFNQAPAGPPQFAGNSPPAGGGRFGNGPAVGPPGGPGQLQGPGQPQSQPPFGPPGSPVGDAGPAAARNFAPPPDLPGNVYSGFAGQETKNNGGGGMQQAGLPHSGPQTPPSFPPQRPGANAGGQPPATAGFPANGSPYPGGLAQGGPWGASPGRPAQPPAAGGDPAPGAMLAPPQRPADRGGNPELGMEGYCPVSLAANSAWVKGDPKWGAIHRGRTYLFAGPAQQQQFIADPDRYGPMLQGYDPVSFKEQRSFVPGRRDFGLTYKNRVYLFADEASLQRFWKSPEEYVPVVEQAMRQSDQQSTMWR